MNTVSAQLLKYHKSYNHLIYNVSKILQSYFPIFANNITTTVDSIDSLSLESILRHRTSNINHKNALGFNEMGVRYFMNLETPSTKIDIQKLNNEELDKTLIELSTKGSDATVQEIITSCTEQRRWIGRYIMHKLFITYSCNGNVELVKLLQKHCLILSYSMFERNGEYEHYIAKAQCMRGNSEKGLSILNDCYSNNKSLRGLYRMILRDLIHDSVLNRSEASMVVFRRHVLGYSEKWGDHYPMICFWHICWVSSWFSDQMIATELLEQSSDLRDIVKEKATAFSVSVLKNEYNEDAVYRLLQILLKYKMMAEYVKVLQILFTHKLKNRDLRGCTEIIRNCETLGIALSQDHQGRYVRMLIEGEPDQKTEKTTAKNFKFKF